MIGLIPIGDAFCAAAACAICCRYSAAILLRCWLISINCGELFITSGENGNGCCINNWFCPTRGNPGFKGHCGVVGVIENWFHCIYIYYDMDDKYLTFHTIILFLN